MKDFFVEGGFGMWPALGFGLLLLGAAARFAMDPRLLRLRFIAALAALEIVVVVHATLLDVSMVFTALQGERQVSDAAFARMLMTGLKESSRPGALGGIFLTLALVFVAVGLYRDGRRALGAAARASSATT